MIGLIGKKLGMTRVFTESGTSIPVTVIGIEDNRVTQLRTIEKDGYSAVQLTSGLKKASRVKRPQAGHFAKAGVEPGLHIREFRTKTSKDFSLGQKVDVSTLSDAKEVDVTGISKGKGFAGTVKRWNFKTQDASHGNSLSHRAPGSIGQNQTPGRVFKGKKMAGQLGNERVTVKKLEVIRVDVPSNIILVRGAVPGSTGSNLIVKPSIISLKR